MRGQVTEIYKVFESAKKKLVVPVYQRNYDWRTEHCEVLLEDLTEIAGAKGKKHFFGAIVGDPEDSWTWTVIDGQQRLTTISILMLALANSIDSGAVTSSNKELGNDIRSSYLVDGSVANKPRFKLKPVKDDAEAYGRLFEDEDLIDRSNITVNYRYFLERLPQLGFTGDEIWDAICGLEVMQLDLGKDDDPQRIFESLNSTGLELSEADKARNLILMSLPSAQQADLYEKYWNRMEKNVDFETPAFLRWYLVTKTKVTPRQDSVYTAFKTFMKDSGLSNQEIASDLRKYSVHYQNYKRPNTGSASVDRRLARLNGLEFDVVIPFVMALLNAWDSGEVSEDDLVQSLRILESYLFRRFASSMQTSALNKIMASLFAEVTKLRKEEDSFSDVLAYSLKRREGSGRFPSDAEFSEGFLTRSFYTGTSRRRAYLFDVLENLDSNDTRDIEKALSKGHLSIEHIMPQTLTATWKESLGDNADEVHATHRNRIGNLTVTGYNSKYSNSDFATKKTTENGFLQSPYRLNEDLKTTEVWGPKQIDERGKRLFEDALSYWRWPEHTFEPPVIPLPTETMGEDNNFTGRDIVSYEFRDASGLVNNWREAFVGILRKLMEIDPVRVLERAQTGAWYHAGPHESAGDGFWKVTDSLSVFVQNSTHSKMSMLRELFELLDLDPDEVTFTLRPATVDTQEDAKEEESSKPYEACRKIARDAAASSASANSQIARDYVHDFLESFADHRCDNPTEVLGQPPVGFLKAPNALEDASEAEILALVSSVVTANEMIDDSILWSSLSDGTISKYLGYLA